MLVKNGWTKLIHFIQDYRLNYLLLFLVVLIAVSSLQASSTFLDPNSFYHVKIIESMNSSSTLSEFTWLRSTNFENTFVDTDWLYHFILSLFISVLPVFLVIKLFAALFAALLALYMYYWLKKHDGAWPLFFVFMLFGSKLFLSELNSLGGEALSMLLLLFGLELVINYKYWLLGLLGIVFAWASGDFIFLFIVAAAWLIVEFIYSRWNLDKFRTQFGNWSDFVLRKLGLRDKMSRKKWLLLIFCTAGLVIGIVTHPHWSSGASLYGFRILDGSTYGGGQSVINKIVHLVIEAYGVLLVTILGLLTVVYNKVRLSKLTTNFLLLLAIFLILFIIFQWSATVFILLSAMTASLLWRDVYSKKFFDHQRIKGLVYYILVVAMVALPLGTHYLLNNEIDESYRLNYMQDVATWLYYHIPDDSLVVNSDWEDWAALFYYNDNSDYWWGLSPNSMLSKYSHSYLDFQKAVDGTGVKSLRALFKDRMKANYILVNTKHELFSQQLSSNIYFNLIYKDKDALIYEVQ